MTYDVWIKARVSPQTKQRFRALAASAGRTESGQLKWMLDAALSTPAERVADALPAPSGPRDGRLSVRLAEADHRLLHERAVARQVPAATYVSLLVRSHLRGVAPLPQAELAALVRSIAELSAIGRNLNQLVRAMHAGVKTEGLTLERATQLLGAWQRLHEHVKALVAANAVSWRGGRSDA